MKTKLTLKYIIPLLLILCLPVAGAVTPKPLPKDFKSLKILAEKGDASAQFHIGGMYYRGSGVKRNPEEGEKWLHKAAEQGLAEAQNYIGVIYMDVKRDYKEAVKWYHKAAEQGQLHAQYNLWHMYRIGGKGVKKDDKEAVKWLRKCAEQGDAGSQYTFALAHEHGIGLEEDLKGAVKWYRKAAEQALTPDQISKAQFLTKEPPKK